MTLPDHATYPPAWYRRLPRPPTEHNLALRRTSLLSQHHLFRDRDLDRDRDRSSRHASPEDVPRRNTTDKPTANGGLEHRASPLQREHHHLEMAEERGKNDNSLTVDAHPRDHLCLCPPDPKIPRPRNSFILFRQHQQASILAQKPGIPNPEVSKIIGEQWRRLSAESKEEWNLLAEEEKARHQQQYPGYRYQPRRNGRSSNQSSVSGPSSAEPQEPCPKCGGKPMNYYSNPTPAPIYTPPASASSQPPPPTPQHNTAMGVAVQVPAKRGYVVSAAPSQRMHGQPAMSPEHVMQQHKAFVETCPFQRVDPRLIYAVPPPQALPTPPSSDSHAQDAKRRRFNMSGGYVPAREAYPEGAYAYAHSPIAASAYARPEVLHPIHHAAQYPMQAIPITKPAMMSPPRPVYPHPPQLQPIRPPQSHHRARSSVVALPPIETVVPQTPVKASSVQSQSSGVEAMIMSIPVLNKIKVLAQISPPLQPPGPTSPKPDVRGAIIAVEGMDAKTVDNMTNSLAEQLEREGKFAVRIFGGPDPYNLIREARRRNSGRDGNGVRPLTTEAYLSMLSQWHKVNQEMVEFITTRPGSEAPQQSSKPSSSVNSSGSSSPQRRDSQLMEGVEESETATAETLASLKTICHSGGISPKTITKAAELSIMSPPPGKQRSQSTPGVSMLHNDNNSNFSMVPPRPLPLAFPRPLNSKRIPPPPPTPPPPPAPPFTGSGSGVSGQSSQQQQQSASSTTIPDPVQVHRPWRMAPPPPSSLEEQQTSSQGAATNINSNPNAIPIALVPHYQLTTVDASSISMPISDGFSPPAHWQWFATLWRGSVGPDITVVIKGVDEDLEAANTGPAQPVPTTANTNTNTNTNTSTNTPPPPATAVSTSTHHGHGHAPPQPPTPASTSINGNGGFGSGFGFGHHGHHGSISIAHHNALGHNPSPGPPATTSGPNGRDARTPSVVATTVEAAAATPTTAATTTNPGQQSQPPHQPQSHHVPTHAPSGVEIRLHDCRAVIVKTGIVGGEAGASGHTTTLASTSASAYHAKELENWEKAKRRVGFEVDEFLRR
ncbi:slightly ste11-like protein [Exophiala dermatitidis]|nr:slightly ste11-like protein [Exophiala dermatitidis]